MRSLNIDNLPRVNLGDPGDGDFFGRARLLAQIREDLLTSSLRIEDLRRVGKTWVAKQLACNLDETMHFVYVDVGGRATPQELHDKIFEALQGNLPKRDQIAGKVQKHLGLIEELQAGPLKLSFSADDRWPENLDRLLSGYAACFDDRLAVLILDELPSAIDEIAKKDTAQAAQLLRLLRSIRANQPNLRTIFCSSIGFHHVLERLNRAGHTSNPLNNLKQLAVGPMDPVESQQLAERLMWGEGITGYEGEKIDSYIAEQVGGYPFFIQNVIDLLKQRPQTLLGFARADIDEAVEDILSSPDDPFRFRDYDSRLVGYHGDRLAEVCRAILDCVAESDTPISHRDIRQQLLSAGGGEGPMQPRDFDNLFRDALGVLEQDRYLGRGPGGEVHFTFTLLRRAWRRLRILD
jgi:hypothetical protein